MLVAKHNGSGAPDVMKTEERIDTDAMIRTDNAIRQVAGTEPVIYFPRAGVNPVQWIQVLHALDQQGGSNSYSELTGWPLLSSLRCQLQKCDKCSQEFCSPVNYRRHISVHHRWRKLDKDSTKVRDLLGAYWDKLSVEEAKEVVSFENVMLKEVPGSSILESLMTLVQKQGFSLLPQYYLRAGAALLDIVQSKPSSFPISSLELFSILDDASEKTCLWGTAVSMQKHLLDGGAGKIGLEPENVVAWTSFLLEQKLVEAWLSDRDAEALRCQKQLVEEEEAAQKRQAEILERKRQKKRRQKEQKARERRHKDVEEIKKNIDSAVKDLSRAEASLDRYNSEGHDLDTFADNNTPLHVPFQCSDTNEGIDEIIQSRHDLGSDQNIERQSARGHNHRRSAVARWQEPPKLQWAVANGLHKNLHTPISKNEVNTQYGIGRDQKAAATVNGSKAWSQKPKSEIDRVVLKTKAEKEPDLVKNHVVLIGSISVNLGNCRKSEGNVVESQEDCMVKNVAEQNSSQDKPMEPDLVVTGNNQLKVRHWRPVIQLETKDTLPVQNGGTGVNVVHGNGDCRNLSGPTSFENNNSHPEGRVNRGSLQSSIHEAKAFLAQRWKEALLSNHVKLVVSPDSKSPRCQEIQHSNIAAFNSSDERCNIIANADNRLPATSRVSRSKHRKKSENGNKTKYIPKQRSAT